MIQIDGVWGGRRAFPSFLSCILAWRRWVSAVLRYGGELVWESVVNFPCLVGASAFPPTDLNDKC